LGISNIDNTNLDYFFQTFLGFLQDGNLVEWNVDTGRTTTVVSKEIMSLVSNTSTFLAFAPNNTNLVKKFEADSLVLIDYMYFKWPSGAILIMRDTFLPILNPLPRCHLVTLARQRAKKMSRDTLVVPPCII